MRKRAVSSAIAIAASISLAACGGGGGSGGGGAPTGGGPAPTPSPAPQVAVCNTAKTLCFPTAKPSAVSEAPAKPRIVFVVMLDDADYNDFGYFSSDAVTPNIDSIAKSGVRLSRYYAGAPICSPSRAAMLTGQSPNRLGLSFLWGDKAEGLAGDYWYGDRGLPAEEGTIAEGLRDEGYRSFFVGKWHLGTPRPEFLPGAHGFDRFTVQLGIGENPASGSFRALTESGNRTVQTEWASKHAADEIISFLDTELAAGRNVFVNWWPPEPHASSSTERPYYIPPTFDRAAFDRDANGKSTDFGTHRGKLVAQLHAFDAQLGRVIDFIKQKNLYDDALIVVTSDNGGSSLALSPSHESAFYKGEMFEGGIRVPFTVSWPKRFAAGTHTNATVSAFDVYPTLLALIGGRVPTGIEGQNMASALLNGTGSRSPLFLQYRATQTRRREDETYYDMMAYIDGCDKLVVSFNRNLLFDVCKDPNERTEISASNPSRRDSLRAALNAHRVRASQFSGMARLDGPTALGTDRRLNVHHDDLSIYASVNVGTSPSGIQTIYRRGEGMSLRIENGRLVANIIGVADGSSRPALRTVSLNAAIPADGRSHRIGFVVRGYFAAASTVSLYVDGQLMSRLAGPLGSSTLEPGTSVLAVKSEDVGATLGSDGLSLTDVRVLTNAIEPHEF